MLPSWLVNTLVLMLTVCKTRKVPLKPSDCVSHVCREATMQDTRWLWILWSTTSTSCPVACSTRKPSPSLVRDSASVFFFKVHLYLPALTWREDKGPEGKGREDKKPENRQCMTVYLAEKPDSLIGSVSCCTESATTLYHWLAPNLHRMLKSDKSLLLIRQPRLEFCNLVCSI